MNRWLVSLVTLSAMVASAADIFVSSDPTWSVAGRVGTTYVDLQTAVNSARAGDTVWIQDGFVQAPVKYAGISSYGYASIKLPNVAFTLRSESGYVDLGSVPVKGAFIQGDDDPESTYDDGRGNNAIRPLWVQNGSTVIQGLVLENGNTGDHHSYGCGGAAYGYGTYTNCIFRNNTAYCGGALGSGSKCRAYNCVFTNNCSFGAGYGGGALAWNVSCWNCEFVGNSSKLDGTVLYSHNTATVADTVFSNCVFRANGNGAVIYLAKNAKYYSFVDCDFIGNKGAGILGMVDAVRCRFYGNTGSAVRANGTSAIGIAPRLEECIVSNNTFAAGVGNGNSDGGGVCGCIARNCIIVGNIANPKSDGMGGCGGGAAYSWLDSCLVAGNITSNGMKGVNSTSSQGGGLYCSSATNCVIANNFAWSISCVSSGSGGGAAQCNLFNCIVTNNYALYRGAAVFNTSAEGFVCRNCLIAGNRSGSIRVGYDRGYIIEGEGANTRSANPPQFYNCTITGNYTERGWTVNDALLYNCIVYGNTQQSADTQIVADHTCSPYLAAGIDGNINCDPKFDAGYHPKSRACRNSAVPYAWMTDMADPSSKDLAGKVRFYGTAPDMGCYEAFPNGLFINVH